MNAQWGYLSLGLWERGLEEGQKPYSFQKMGKMSLEQDHRDTNSSPLSQLPKQGRWVNPDPGQGRAKPRSPIEFGAVGLCCRPKHLHGKTEQFCIHFIFPGVTRSEEMIWGWFSDLPLFITQLEATEFWSLRLYGPRKAISLSR